MRRRAVVLSLGAIALSSFGCGNDADPNSKAGVTTTGPTAAVVTPADYALRAERRCSKMVTAQRRGVIAARSYGSDPTSVTRRVFLRTYRDVFSTSAEQVDRLARLTPPDEYVPFRRALRASARIIVRLDRRIRRSLDDDSSPVGILRVLRLVDRTSFSVPDDTLPEELGRRAPSCETIFGPRDDGGGQVTPDTLQALNGGGGTV